MRLRSSGGFIFGALLALLLPVWAIAQDLPERTPKEVFRLGGADAPEYAAFTWEPDLVVASDGTLFVRPRSGQTVAVFDSAGGYLRSIGRAGDGPGEFERAWGHGFVGDTLWIINWPTPRVSLFLRDGTHLSTERLERIDYGRRTTAPQSLSALLEGGHGIAIPSVYPVGEVGRIRLPVYVGDRALTERRVVAQVVQPSGLYVDGVGTFALRPFPIPPLVSVFSDGSGFLVVNWDEGDPEHLRLERFSAEGETVWSRTETLDAPPVPESLRSEWVARGVEMAGPYVKRAREEGRLGGRESVESLVEKGLYIPDRYPPVDLVVAGADGSIWLGPPVRAETREWRVLASDGSALYRTRLPASVEIRAATERSAWGTETGELDVPYVVRIDLR